MHVLHVLRLIVCKWLFHSADFRSSRGSSAVAAVKVVQSSESDVSSEKRSSTGKRTRRSGGLSVGSPRDEKVVKGSEGSDPGSRKEERRLPSEEEGSLEFREGNTEDTNPDDKAESCGEESGSQEEESGSVCMNIEDGRGDEPGKQESSSSEENTAEEEDEKDGEEDDGAAEEKEDRQTDKEQEKSDVKEDHGASGRKNATQEDEETQETGAEDEEQESEVKEILKNNSELRQRISAVITQEVVDALRMKRWARRRATERSRRTRRNTETTQQENQRRKVTQTTVSSRHRTSRISEGFNHLQLKTAPELCIFCFQVEKDSRYS